MSPSRRVGTVWVLLVLGALVPCAVVALERDPLRQFRSVEAALLLLGAVMGLALLAVWRGVVPHRRTALLLILGVALAARLAFLAHPPSDDVHRYLWEGRVQLHGVNPYAVPPDDPSLEPLRDAGFARINHPEWTAIYGPAAEALFALVALLSPSVAAWKSVVCLCDWAAMLLLLALLRARGRSPLWVVGYAWNPLVLWSFAGEAHVDAVLTVALVAALLGLERNRPVRAGLAYGIGLLVKPTLVALLPLFFIPRRQPRALIAIGVLAIGLYLPYAAAGWGLFRSLIRFGVTMRFNDLPSWLLGDLLGPVGLRAVAIGGFAVALAWLWRKRPAPADGATLLLGASILVAPTVQPWYGAPLAACNCVTRSVAWWVLIVSLIVALETAAGQAVTGEWHEAAWVRWATYGPFLFVAAAEMAWRRRAAR